MERDDIEDLTRSLLVIPNDDSDLAAEYNLDFYNDWEFENLIDICEGVSEALSEGLITCTRGEKLKTLSIFCVQNFMHLITKPLAGSTLEVHRPIFDEIKEDILLEKLSRK